jgi:hypothetical protein
VPAQATSPWRPRWQLTAHGCDKVGAMLTALQWLVAVEDAATEGKKVITGMLIVGLIFVSVIAVGQTLHYLRHRRR